MSHHIITCEIRAGALPALKALRRRHLEYIASRQSEILFGGPARGPDGTPQTMVIVLEADDATEAEAFIASEPYNASGEVFAEVKVRPWSQVLPEAEPGALARALAAEGASHDPSTEPHPNTGAIP